MMLGQSDNDSCGEFVGIAINRSQIPPKNPVVHRGGIPKPPTPRSSSGVKDCPNISDRNCPDILEQPSSLLRNPRQACSGTTQSALGCVSGTGFIAKRRSFTTKVDVASVPKSFTDDAKDAQSSSSVSSAALPLRFPDDGSVQSSDSYQSKLHRLFLNPDGPYNLVDHDQSSHSINLSDTVSKSSRSNRSSRCRPCTTTSQAEYIMPSLPPSAIPPSASRINQLHHERDATTENQSLSSTITTSDPSDVRSLSSTSSKSKYEKLQQMYLKITNT
jgi:hypothetical protein